MAVGALVLAQRPLVPVELEPAQRVEDLLDVLGRRALAVGVLDPQDERPARAAREQPVVERRPRAADVQGTRRRGREADCSCARADRRPIAHAMLIGAHVSTAGGLPRRSSAASRASATRSRSSTRARAPGGRSRTRDEEVAEFREAMDDSRVEAVVIHAVYLINTRHRDDEMRRKSLDVAHRTRSGSATRSAPPGWSSTPAAQKGTDSRRRCARSARRSARCSAETETLPDPAREHRRHPGTAGPRLRRAGEAGRARRRRRAHRRSASTAATCSPPASTSATPDGAGRGRRRARPKVGLDRLRCLHINDSQIPARVQPRPPRQRRQGRDGPQRASRRSSPSPASRACRRCSRPRPRTSEAPSREEVQAARSGLRREG